MLAPEWLHDPLLVLIGIAAAALNAVAGGGTFFTFPLLILFGLDEKLANTTNKVAIWVGACASIFGYKKHFQSLPIKIAPVCLVTVVGSLAGSLSLLWIANEHFKNLVPYLLLGATLLFAFSRPLLDALNHINITHAAKQHGKKAALTILQFVVGFYGGFFGAGIGILLLALSQMMGLRDIHQSNALKVILSSALLSFSALSFIIAGAVNWAAAIPLMAGMLIGGYAGASIAKYIPALWIRGFIIIYGLAMSATFFVY